MIKEFRINVSEEQISNINNKVKNYPWQSIEDMEGWIHGTNKTYLKEICKYWISEFDWKKHEELINSFSNFKTNVEGIDIHFIKEEGSGKNPKPLLLMHGWPGSIVEFLEIIKPLAHPEEFGGNIEDAFTVIVPSLPGFGFSNAPKNPMGPRKIANIMNKFMSENLNYKQYFAQGGDWGATIANWLGYDHHENCIAMHINCLTMRHPGGPETNEEKKWLNESVLLSVIEQRRLWSESEKESLKAITDFGVKIIKPSKELFQKKTNQIIESFKGDTLVYNLINRIRKIN